MFTPDEREAVLADLLRRAGDDPSVVAAALVGSAARGALDRWSDVDLALRLRPGLDPEAVADAWTEALTPAWSVADHLDVVAGPALYRVLLLPDSLQVDLSFWPWEHFRATGGEPFQLVFGEAATAAAVEPPDPAMLVGRGWLHALHARSAIARSRCWQAVQMVDGLRDQLVALACARHGLPGHHGRGVDGLPQPLLADLARTLVAAPTPAALRSALDAGLDLLLVEAGHVDPGRAARLLAPVEVLRASLRSPGAPP